MDEKKIIAIKDFIATAEKSLNSAKKLLSTMIKSDKKGESSVDFDTSGLYSYESNEQKIIEGVFTGESMLGSNGSIYPVPQNYASKSKLVQGSKLKAIIDGSGKITYKIIEEIESEQLTGVLIKDKDKFQVIANGKTYNVLLAPITYLKAEIGDTIAISVPKGRDATFASVDAVIPKELKNENNDLL